MNVRRNITSEVTSTEMDLAETIARALQLANAADVSTGNERRYHSVQAPFYAYGDLYVALRHLLTKLYGVDGREVYETMIDTGEGVAWVVASIIAERIPDPCPECGWQYDDAVLQQAAAGALELDHHPTHPCGATRRLRDLERARLAVEDEHSHGGTPTLEDGCR